MKSILLLLLIYVMPSYGQPNSPWETVFDTTLIGDFTNTPYPGTLLTPDSATCYFGFNEAIDDDSLINTPPQYISHWYRTINAGKSWSKMQFDSFPVPGAWGTAQITAFAPDANTLYMYTKSESGDFFLIFSTDNGDSWQRSAYNGHPLINRASDFALWAPIAKNYLIRYNDSLTRFQSSVDYGKSFSVILGDSLFKKYKYLEPSGDTTDPIANAQTSHIITSSTFNWSFAVREPIPSDTSKFFPTGLNIFTTQNGGRSWFAHNYKLPKDTSAVIRVNLQAIANTKDLYAFNSYFREGSNHYLKGGYVNTLPNLSFLYSSDFGETWTSNYNYGNRFRAFEASPDGNIWLTIAKSSFIDYQTPAYWIAHSTDNGTTWDLDTNTLRGGLEVPDPLDGQIISSSGSTYYLAAKRRNSIVLYKYNPKRLTIENGSKYLLPASSFYPQPADNRTTLIMPETANIREIDLYNIIGRKMNVQYTLKSSFQAEFATHILDQGVYFAIVKYEENSYVGNWLVPLIITR